MRRKRVGARWSGERDPDGIDLRNRSAHASGSRHAHASGRRHARASSRRHARASSRRCDGGGRRRRNACGGSGRDTGSNSRGDNGSRSADGSGGRSWRGGHRCESRRASAVGQWHGHKRGRTACAADGCADAEPGGAHAAGRRRAPDGADVVIHADCRRNSVGIVFSPGFHQRRRGGERTADRGRDRAPQHLRPRNRAQSV